MSGMDEDEDVGVDAMAGSVGVAGCSGKKRKQRKARPDDVSSKRRRTAKGSVTDRVYSDEEPSVTAKLGLRKAHVTMRDVQELVVWVAGDYEKGKNPKWVFVQNKPLIPSVLLVCVDSLGPELWEGQGRAAMPFLADLAAETGGHPLPTQFSCSAKRMKPDAFVEDLFFCERPTGAGGGGGRKRGPPIVSTAAFLQSFAADGVPGLPAAKPAEAKPAPKPTPAEAKPAPTPTPAEAKPPPAATDPATELVIEGESIPWVPPAEAAQALQPFLAQPSELEQAGFPGSEMFEDKLEGALPEFVATAGAEGMPSPGLEIVCLDCEMCLTEKGHELTRCTFTDWKGTVIYDTLVKPQREIVDYLTRFSGVTEEMMRDVQTTLEDVRGEVLSKYLCASTVLVGHSLENDLAALRISHQCIADTSLLYPHPNGLPYRSALKYLAFKFLGRCIQGYNSSAPVQGHDSVEDATAALHLLRLKLAKGHMFGLPRRQSHNAVADWAAKGGRVAIVDGAEAASRITRGAGSTVDFVGARSDTDAEKKVLTRVQQPESIRTVWVRLRGIAETLEKAGWDAAEAPCGAIEERLQETDSRVKRLWERMPGGSLLLVLSPQQNGIRRPPDEEEARARWTEAKKGLLWMRCKPRGGAAAAEPDDE